MTERVHRNPKLIFSVGTQVVTLRDLMGDGGRVLNPRGSVGVITKLPHDLDHSYRVRFPGGVEQTVRREDVVMLAQFKEGQIGDAAVSGERGKLLDRVMYWFRGWEMHADKAELDSILAALWTSTEPQVIARLLRIFSNRSLPKFDGRLIDLCQHHDEDVRRSAFNALAANADEAIHTFALQCLATEPARSVISLFTKNFRCGDEERLLEAITLPDDLNQLHWLLMDVIEVLKSNSEADCSRLAVIAYGSTPCQNCRFNAARLLQKQEVAPEWLIEECRFDAEKRCRELFGGRANE